MKKAFIAAACMIGIITVRMILSVALSEQLAEVFTRISVGSLFFYFILILGKNKIKPTNSTIDQHSIL